MAAVTKLGLLLIVLISGIHGEENFYEMMEKGGVYTFHPPKEANFCVISRSIGEENLVLWNTSDLSPENRTLPEDLKKRLEVSKMMNISSYKIHNLTHSDSGLYRRECWTDGNVTHQQNISITVCSTRDERDVMISARRIGYIPCKGEREGDNLTVQWFMGNYINHHLTRMFLDDNRSLNPLMKDLEGRVQLVENSSSLRISNYTRRDIQYYNCLVMEKQQCVSSNIIYVSLQRELILHSVGEEAVLPCFDTDLYGPANWNLNDGSIFLLPPSQNHSEGFGNLTDREQQYRYSDAPVMNDDFSLVFSSLTLNHSGYYECYNEESTLDYDLMVCPESEPLTQFFSDGEEVSLSCNSNTTELGRFIWVRKTEQEKIVILYPTGYHFLNKENIELYEGFKNRFNVSSRGTTVVLLNLSAEDSGEYWCVVLEYTSCKLTAKTILIYKHPFGIHSTFYAVWSSMMSCGLLGMVCAVVTVNVKYRRREQVPVI